MKFIYVKYLLFFLTFMLSTVLIGQSNYEGFSRILSKHIQHEKLDEINDSSDDVYSKIMYYFYSSFTVSDLYCDTCSIDYSKFFNVHLFDITTHEDKRLENDEFTFVFKDRFTVTLHSKESMNNELNGLSVNELLTYTSPRDFPEWEVVTGDDDEDYKIYKQKVYDWAKDFPAQYREITSSPDLFKISIKDFKELAPERRELVLNADQYLIIN